MECQLKRPVHGQKLGELIKQHGPDGLVRLTLQTMMISNKALGDSMVLTEQNGKIGFAPASQVDPNEQWIIDDSWGATLHDDEGNRAFAIVNLKTGKAIQQPVAKDLPVRTVLYQPNYLVPDTTLLWTSKAAGDGFINIRELKNTSLVLDAVLHGLLVVAATYKGADCQLWKMKDQI